MDQGRVRRRSILWCSIRPSQPVTNTASSAQGAIPVERCRSREPVVTPSPLSRQGGHQPALRGRRSGERAKEIQALINLRWRKTGSQPEKDKGKTGFVESSLFRIRAWLIRLSLSSRWGLCPRTPARMIAPDMRGRARLSIYRWKIMDRRAGVFYRSRPHRSSMGR